MTENLQKQWGRIYSASSWIFKKCSVLPFPAHMPDTYLPSGWKSACPFWVWLSRGLFYKLESSCRSQCTCLEHSVCTWEEVSSALVSKLFVTQSTSAELRAGQLQWHKLALSDDLMRCIENGAPWYTTPCCFAQTGKAGSSHEELCASPVTSHLLHPRVLQWAVAKAPWVGLCLVCFVGDFFPNARPKRLLFYKYFLWWRSLSKIFFWNTPKRIYQIPKLDLQDT